MQERHHVKTTPGEPHAVPEYTPHPVRKEDGHDVQTDDINIPLVAMLVAFFGVVLAITIVSLQAWFYNSQAAEDCFQSGFRRNRAAHRSGRSPDCPAGDFAFRWAGPAWRERSRGATSPEALRPGIDHDAAIPHQH